MKLLSRWLVGLLALLALAGATLAQTPAPATDKQQRFTTAQAAADTLAEAIRKDDGKAIEAILGTGWRDLVPGNTAHEDDVRANFLKAWDEQHKILPKGDDKAVIEAGNTGWRMPIPLVKDDRGWRYDVAAGREEILAREIGRDELTVIQTLLAVVDAQQDYAQLDPMKVGVATYARRLLSSPGKKDGLYWETSPGEPPSPLGALVAKAQPGDGPGQGYFGYHFRLLYGQGPAAKGGAYSYLVNNRMVGGFGAIAWPVTYGETGVMTFIVNQDGIVYERDLGPQTSERAAAINSFDPGEGWEKADMTPP